MNKNYAETSLKRFLKRRVKVTLGLVVSFLITGSISFAAGEELKEIPEEVLILEESSNDRFILFSLIEKMKYKTKSDSKMLSHWDKYDGNANYEANPLSKENLQNKFNKKENTLEITTGGKVVSGSIIKGQLEQNAPKDFITINTDQESIGKIDEIKDKVIIGSNDLTGKGTADTSGNSMPKPEIILGSIDNGNIKVNSSQKEDIEIDVSEGNTPAKTINKDNSGNIANSGTMGAEGSFGGGQGGVGGNGSNNTSHIIGNTQVDNTHNYVVIGGTGGTGGQGGLGGRDRGDDKPYIPGLGGTGGNGGYGSNATGLDYTKSAEKIILSNNYTVTGGTGGAGGKGGDGGWNFQFEVHAVGGTGGNGATGGNAIGVNLKGTQNELENNGNILAIGGTGGTGGNGGYTQTPSPDIYQTNDGGNGGKGGDAIGLISSSNTIKNNGTILALGGKGGVGGKTSYQGHNGSSGNKGTGIGISGNNNNIFNTGFIAGTTAGISGNNNNITNIGIIGSGNNNIVSGSGNTFTNAGITVNIDSNGKITNIVNSSTGIEVTVNGKKYTSMQMAENIGNQENKIINATNTNKHLTLNNDTTFNNVIINGADYNNASVIINSGKTKVENSIINSLNSNALKVNDKGELIFSQSKAQGNIDLSSGNNKLTFSNGSSLTGEIITGSGKNELVFDRARYETSLDLSKGDDSITIKNGSILGNITLGNGTNKVVIDNAEYDKDLDMSQGNDELHLKNGGILSGNVTFGAGNNKLYINNTTVKNNFDLKDGNNLIDIKGAISSGTITSGKGNDTLSILNSIVKNNINLGDGVNKITLNNSGITGNIITGNDNDILDFQSSVIKGTVNLGNGNNNVTISGTNNGIDGDLIIGTGNDNLTITDNSMITGNANLGTGDNTTNITNGSIGGNLVSNGNNSIITLENGKIFGNAELGSGLTSLTMNNSGIKGNITATGNKDNVFDLISSTLGGKLITGDGNNTITLNNNSGILDGINAGIGNDKLILTDSFVKEEINLGNGNNTVLGNDSIITGNVIAGTGDDKITLNNSLIKSENKTALSINLGDGKNSISLKNNSGISGNLSTGIGDDTLDLLDSIIKGTVNLSNGNNNIIISGSNKGINGDLITGNGNDNLTISNNAMITGNTNLGSGDNVATITDSSIGKNLISNGNNSTINLTNSKIFGNTEFGSGLTKLTMVSSGIKENVITAGDKDNIFDLTNSTIGGKLTTGNGDNTITLKENSGILKGITLGLGNDNLSLKDSLIKGEVNLGDGENIVNFKDSAAEGELITGIGNDNLSFNNSLLIGNLNLGNGNNIVNMREGSIVSGDITLGMDNDILNILDSQVQGNVNISGGDNTITVDSNSYVFGKIITGTGNDNIEFKTEGNKNKYFDLSVTLGGNNVNEENILTIGSNNYLNGSILGSDGKDVVNIGDKDSSQNIFNLELNKIEDVILQGNTKIKSTAKMFADKITVKGKGDTFLEVDTDITKNKLVHTGHGLYGNIGVFETEDKDSHLIVDTSKINNNSIVKITGNLNLTDDQIKSDSLIHSVYKNENGDIQVTVDHSLPILGNTGNSLPNNGKDGGFIRYEELNKVYQSIYTAEKIGYLAQDTKLSDKDKEKAYQSLLSFLNQIYANNIYGYAPKLSIDSMDIYKEAITNNIRKLPSGEKAVTGVALYSHKEKQNDAEGRNFYGFDHGTEKFNVKTNMEGLMANFEYGLTNNQTIGLDIAGAKQQSSITNGSKLKADSFYIGLHNNYIKDNFKAVIGIGLQLNAYDGERIVKTNYSYSKNDTDFSTLSCKVYGNMSYKLKLTDTYSFIPFYDISADMVKMDSAKEKHTKDSLGIETDSKDIFILNNEAGFKIQNKTYRNNTRYIAETGLSYINRSGDTEYNLTGRVREGGTNFDILGENIEHNNIKAQLNFRADQDNGLFYNLNLSYEYGEKDRETYKGTIGIGYTF